jgi:hypothetical protein
MAKLGAILFCLAFVVSFGAVGVGATWAIASTVYDAMRSGDWVKARASVDPLPAESYRYSFQGREYTGSRLGTFALGGSSDVDDWDERLAAYLSEARESGKPIMVYVNPDNPAEALIDRDIRWKLLLFMSPFALVFGGVGVGALYAMIRIIRGRKRQKKKSIAARDKRVIATSADTSVGFMWMFALLWNAISWPIAILAVPEMLQGENWIGLLVLLFPFIGLMLLWGAIRMTFGKVRGGKATLKLQTDNPRVGGSLAGAVVFAKPLAPGTVMRVRLLCLRVEDDNDGVSTRPQWNKDQVVPVSEGPEGSQATFRFDVPAEVPATSTASTGKVTYRWRLDVHPAKQVVSVPQSFEIEMQAAAPDAFAAPRATVATLATPAFQTIEKLLGDMGAGPLSSEQKAAFARMTPEQQATVAKVVRWAPSGKKIFFIAVAFLLAVEFLPTIFRLITR